MITDKFLDMLDRNVMAVFNQENISLANNIQYTQLFGTHKLKVQKGNKFSGYTGLGVAQYTPEGQTFHSDDSIQGFDITVNALKWTKAFPVTKEMIENSLFPDIMDSARQVVLALIQREESLAADVFRYGFVNTPGFSTLGGDGQTLFSIAHPYADPGTAGSQRNVFTAAETHMDLAEDAAELAATKMRAFLNERGQLLQVNPDTLAVGPNMIWDAERLVRSEASSAAANNNSRLFNTMKGKFKIVVLDYLGAGNGIVPGSWLPETSWMMFDSNLAKMLLKMAVFRERTLESDKIMSKDIMEYYGSLIKIPFFRHWIFSFMSLGDNTNTGL